MHHAINTSSDLCPGSVPVRILVAEDDDQTRELLEKILQLQGWQVHAVADGRQAVDAWGAGSYDLVLLDLGMPEMDGDEVTRRIRDQEGGSGRVPIILYSAFVLKEGEGQCVEGIDVDEYLPKPVRLQVLYATIHRHLRGEKPPTLA